MNKHKYSLRELDESRLLDLRVIARDLGVERPTTLDKQKLMENILKKQEEVSDGGSTAQRGPARGRPPKKPLVGPMFGYEQSAPPAENYQKPPQIIPKASVFDSAGLDGAFDSLDAFSPAPAPASAPAPVLKPVNEAQSEKKERAPYVQNERTFYKKPETQIRQESQNRQEAQNKQDDDSEEKKEQVSIDEFPIVVKEGVLEIMQDGYGFLRARNCEPGDGDAYIAAPRIKKCGLRKGDYIKAETKKQAENRPGGVINILEVNGRVCDGTPLIRKNFDNLTPIYPDSRLRLEIPGQKNDFAIRAIDLISPIGKGQRAMIVSPPKAGKTTLLKKIANSISKNYPKVHLLVLLIDERPEEVTDMQRSIKGEVVYSTFDEVPEHHTRAAEMVLERAKRLVELGEDVVILMDSLTRLARAYNLVVAPTGRTLSGGIDPGALHSPKRFFGAARNIEYGGSLTIIASALVDTGSRMDDVIYEEFKGTGNMEIHLDRKLSEKRIFPAIDLNRSGTRREEILLDQKELEAIWGMRKMLSNGENADATESLINMLVKTNNNAEFIEQLNYQLRNLADKGYKIR